MSAGCGKGMFPGAIMPWFNTAATLETSTSNYVICLVRKQFPPLPTEESNAPCQLFVTTAGISRRTQGELLVLDLWDKRHTRKLCLMNCAVSTHIQE